VITVGLYGIADTTHGLRPTYVHDHGLAILRDGQVLTAIELERATGRKHDNRLPEFIGSFLARHVPQEDSVRFVSVNTFLGNSFVSQDGNLRIEPQSALAVEDVLCRARVRWFPDGKQHRAAEGFVMCHEFAHIASILPFVGRFEEGALLVHIDGGASDSACSSWTIEGKRPRLLSRSWDRLKRVVNNFNDNPLVRIILGLDAADHLAMPGKLMGYAGHGVPTERTMSWLDNHDYFLNHCDKTPEGRTLLREEVARHFGISLDHFDPHRGELKEICACLQAAFERDVLATLADWKRSTGARILYLAGGAALNIPTNVRIEQMFGRVFIPPCTSDSGLALGAAAWVEYMEREQFGLHGPFLNAFDVPAESPSLHALDEVADLLVSGAVVGLCNGAAEIGPRALGHRSLIARADSKKLTHRISQQIKGREWYRPLAPVLCEEAASEVLGEAVAGSPLARYMLGAWHVKLSHQSQLDGVLHRDGTVRAQVITQNDRDNEFLHELLWRLWRSHGIPALINTSFNVRGQPILHRHEDALRAAQTMGLDAVVIHGSLYRL
jgi:carbamoyltransferase